MCGQFGRAERGQFRRALTKARALKDHVHARTRQWALLLPKAGRKRSRPNKAWKLYVNAKVEAEL
jgi:hypothetical protein